MDVPPPRYRVVEKDRRLVVVDQRTDRRSAPTRAGRASPFERKRFDGSGVLRTERWFDDKGPRVLAVDGASASWLRMMLGVAGMLKGAAPFIGRGTRDALRQAATVQLDRFLPAEDR